CRNNPVNSTDPTGMIDHSVAAAASERRSIINGLRETGLGIFAEDEARYEQVVHDAFRAFHESTSVTVMISEPDGDQGQNPTSGDAIPVDFTFKLSVIPGDPERQGLAGYFGSYLLVQVLWKSSTGNLADLAGYQMREKLEYAGPGTEKGIYTAPEPFNFSRENPYRSKSINMSDGGIADRHAGYTVFTPYKKAALTITQTYQYS